MVLFGYFKIKLILINNALTWIADITVVGVYSCWRIAGYAVSGLMTFLERTCGIAEVVERALHGIINPRKKNTAMSHGMTLRSAKHILLLYINASFTIFLYSAIRCQYKFRENRASNVDEFRLQLHHATLGSKLHVVSGSRGTFLVYD